MRSLKRILVASLVVASLYAAAGTAWARSESLPLGTAWTDADDPGLWDGPSGISWELLDF
ncbi:MAG TPA: hypothetical protein VKE23_03730 [Candidatus Limnocylindria bacterium]|nr:hypothetical protein [Candidatus Limnocylindria bacterium]